TRHGAGHAGRCRRCGFGEREGLMPHRLREDQVAQYARDGYLFPVPVLDAAEVALWRGELESWERERGAAIDFPEKSKSYLLFNWPDRLVHHPRILDAVQDLIG